MAEPGEAREPLLLTLVSADGAQHPVPRPAALQHSKLLAEMAEDTEHGAAARDLEVPLPELSAGAVAAFVAFARQLDGDPRGVLGVGGAAFAEAWGAADRLIAGEWQRALAAAWSEELRAQARIGGGESEALRAAAAELEAVLDPAVSPLLSMLDAEAVALLYYRTGEAAAEWAEAELGAPRRRSQGVAVVDGAGDGVLAGSELRHAVIRRGAEAIGDRAFFRCSALAAVAIPDAVTTIGNNAFQGCSSLAAVAIPDAVTTIGNGAFCGCIALAAVAIPDSVTAISDSAFDGCSSLAAVAIPDSVTAIGA
jgi:hypothetical protein